LELHEREVQDLEFYDRRIQGIIEDVIQWCGVHPDFAQAADFALSAEFAQAAEFAAVLRQCVGDLAGSPQPSGRPLPWRYLPILCCQAVRGNPDRHLSLGEMSALSGDPAIVVAAALELARLAAQILDDVEDGDAVRNSVSPGCGPGSRALWLSSGVPQAVNVGTGLIFASLLALSRLGDCGVAPEIVADLQAEFARTGFRMCQGQHLDLVAEAEEGLSLEGYWQMAEAKTGAFLELACRAGALLGGAGEEESVPYAGYGHYLGFLVQVVNDLGGLLDEERNGDLVRHKKTLPLIYALSVAGEEEGERLRRAWAEAPYDAAACREVRRLVVELGALQYAFVQGELHYQHALSALQKAGTGGVHPRDPEALAGLAALLDQYRPTALLGRVAGQTEFGT